MSTSTSRKWTTTGIALGLALSAALAVLAARTSSVLGDGRAGDDDGPPKKDEPAPATSPTAGWYLDPDCRLVFFATLEGLYEDGIPTEVVDLILGEGAKLTNGVKRNFVFRCKLCHAVYEAFALYRRRPTFNGSKVDTFKDGSVAPELVEQLRSGEARTRVFAMGSLVQPWIKRKLLALHIDDAEKAALSKRLMALVEEGNALLDAHRRDDPEYGPDWSFYGACQACKAVETVSGMLKGK